MDIYTLGKPDAQGNIDFTNCQGLAYRGQWITMEPQEGQYNWTEPDAARSHARRARKLLSISVTAGAWTPQWVYDAGAQSYSYQGAGTGPQGTSQMPQPWDAIYIRKLKNFLRAFNDRYGSKISHTNVAGINSDTQEVLLPAEVSGGYPPDLNARLQDVWGQLLDFYQATFNLQFFGMHGRGFLPEPDITSTLVDTAIADYPGYGLQWNGWGTKDMWAKVTASVGKCTIGLQEGATLGTQSGVTKAMSDAEQVGAAFGEMYSDDLQFAG